VRVLTDARASSSLDSFAMRDMSRSACSLICSVGRCRSCPEFWRRRHLATR
jgi:hypothetical protein